MRILFCNTGSVSLGIQYLSAALKRAGHVVDLLSAPGLDASAYWYAPWLRPLNRYARLVKLTRRFEPDLIAFTCFTSGYQFVLELSRRLKAEMDVPTVIGGTHATALPEHVLKNPAMDMVCIGEGEEALLELVTKMERGEDFYDTRNFWFKKNGEIIRNPLRPLVGDLDSLPFPDTELFRNFQYFSGDAALLITSRGCPYSCSYCEVSMYDDLYGRTRGKFRRRSVDNVIEELLLYKRTKRLKKVFFADPIFLTNTQWVVRFLERYNKEIDLPFVCNGRPENINEELVEALSRCRSIKVLMGLDSGDKQLRKTVLNRHCSDERILKAAGLIKQAGISFQLSAIFALPGETEEDMWQTVEMLDRLKPSSAGTYTLFPYPGTAFYHSAIRDGLLSPERVEQINNGKGGFHHFSVIRHPNAKQAMTITNMLPLYLKSPRPLRPVLKWIMKKRMWRLSYLCYGPLALILFPEISAILAWSYLRSVFHILTLSRLSLDGPPAGGR